MKSMTGYGEAAGQSEVKLALQLRSLNHRHLDIQLRTPKVYFSLEEELRKRIRRKISRGRVELFIARSPLKGQGRKLELDESLMDQYLAALRRVKRKLRLKGEIGLPLLSRLPDLFRFQETEFASEREKALVLRTLETALRSLERSREREGRHLKSDIQDQASHLRRISGQLRREARKNQGRLEDSLRPGEAGGGPEPPDRGGAALKGDINEEVVRLRSHLEALSALTGRKEPVGKKIEFLLQEVQRELNTIGSKVPHLSVVRLVLEGKERVEKIREQVQNVE